MNETLRYIAAQGKLSNDTLGIKNHQFIVDLEDVPQAATRAYISTKNVTALFNEVSVTAARLYLHLYSCSSCTIIPTTKQLSDVLGVSPKTINNSKSILKSAGYLLEIKYTHKRHSTYTLVLGKNYVLLTRGKQALTYLVDNIGEAEVQRIAKEDNGDFDKLISEAPSMDIYVSTPKKKETTNNGI